MSKRIWQHPEAQVGETTVSWRSVGQLEETPAFREHLDREFPRSAAEMADEADAETSRRSFLKIMGASSALAGLSLASCRRAEKYTVPYTQAPEWVIPGKALYYASAMPRAGGATPLVVTSFEGRPTKLAPNKLHPDADGTDAFAQATILDLYNPSRSQKILHHGNEASRADMLAMLKEVAKAGKIGIVFGADESPTRSRLAKEIATKFAGSKFYSYEALSPAVGDGVKLVADFAKADRILALDCDFASLDPQGPVGPFFARRKPEGKNYTEEKNVRGMNRLYAVESLFSLTGGMADHRLRIEPSKVIRIAADIARKLAAKNGTTASPLVSQYAPISEGRIIEWVDGCVSDLIASAGRSVVLAGSRTSAPLKAIAMAINQALGNVGDGKPLLALQSDNTGLGDFTNLIADLTSGAVENVIFVTPANPVYDAPSDLDFVNLLGKAKTSIHLGMRTDATAHTCTWHIPATHYLESWSDARTAKGVHTIIQPMILPLYENAISEFELLSALLDADTKLVTGEESSAFAAVRTTVGGDDVAWKKTLREGFVAGSSQAAATPETANVTAAVYAEVSKDSLDVIFSTDGSIYDGRWVDNAWLQESPDPISKLTWDNAALIAPKTAKELGIYDQIIEIQSPRAASPVDGEAGNRRAPLIQISLNGKQLTIPVLIAFGLSENTLVLPLGYGQAFDKDDELKRAPKNETHCSLVGVNRGFDVYPLRTQATSYLAQGAKVTTTEERYSVALTQEHHAMYGRSLAREISTQPVAEKGSFEKQYDGVRKQGNDSHAPENISLYKPTSSATWHPGKDGKEQPHLSDDLHQWAMNIDLSSCMGCNACLVACQAENNIPVVGKEQVAKGRAMHWIRMDRYFAQQKDNTFDQDNPAMVPQPVACVQCESAPCETVCPVNATIHTEDGLNAMAYNRCIGTRYCANNCPYKARRFNYFDYNKRNPLIAHNLYRGPLGETQVGTSAHLQRNPNVTVRMRGVMEKCTYCVQRLKESKIRQKRGQKQEVLASGKPSTDFTVGIKTLRIPVDSVKVACQEACPAEAITFGNILDGKDAAVVRGRELARSYELLHYIGTIPRTLYMARVKNPNPAMPDAQWIGRATIDMA
jgi:molybdopterin-containing oxidoreductase family iron-sulfur binding subunit